MYLVFVLINKNFDLTAILNYKLAQHFLNVLEFKTSIFNEFDICISFH